MSGITQLPPGYRQVYRLTLMDMANMVWLNVLSLVLLVPFAALMIGWTALVQSIRGLLPGDTILPWPVLWLLVLLVFPLHELVHGLVIQWTGHYPRYGSKSVRIGPIRVPVVLFATADDAYFRRNDFIAIALAPAVVITLAGMLLVLLLPDAFAAYITLAVVFNGSGAVGDLWMTAVVLRYPPESLVRDEEDSITVFVPLSESEPPTDHRDDHPTIADE